jgi:hypothetical protein
MASCSYFPWTESNVNAIARNSQDHVCDLESNEVSIKVLAKDPSVDRRPFIVTTITARARGLLLLAFLQIPRLR